MLLIEKYIIQYIEINLKHLSAYAVMIHKNT